MSSVPAVLLEDDHLEAAVKVFNLAGEPHIPVVADKQSMALRGLVHQHEVMLAYQRGLNQARAEERGKASSRSRRRPWFSELSKSGSVAGSRSDSRR